MVQFGNFIIFIYVIGLAILFSGCVGKPAGTPTPAATETPTATVTYTGIPTPTAPTTPVIVTTPTPTAAAPLLSGALYVAVRMKEPTHWGSGTYKLSTLQAQITDVINQPISIKAQIVSGGQILEEQSFTIQSGSSINFANEGPHVINSTNVSLRLLAQGYQPAEYNITTIYG